MRLPGNKRRTPRDIEFFLYEFKTKPCTVDRVHEWRGCPCVHDGETARRRDPRVYSYSADPCADFMQKGSCPKGDVCPLAHGVFETWLHPTKFCTVMCTDGSACRRKVCWFAHSASELRSPTSSPTAAAGHAAAAGAAGGAPFGSATSSASFAPAPPAAGCFSTSQLSAACGFSTGGSSRVVPVSIAPMLASTPAAMASPVPGSAAAATGLGSSHGLPVGINPLAGLLSSLEEQALQAQLEAASLQAVLSAFGALTVPQQHPAAAAGGAGVMLRQSNSTSSAPLHQFCAAGPVPAAAGGVYSHYSHAHGSF